MTDRFDRSLSHVLEATGRRDPTAATQPLRWVNADLPMVAEWDAEQAYRFGYIANVVAYRCVQVIAETIANLPFRAGPNPDQPHAYNTAARLARLLGPTPGGPAPGLSARTLWTWSIAQRLTTGRWAWELELAPGSKDIVNVWPLVSASLNPFASTGGTAWFKRFEYGRSDQKKRLTADQVFYAWTPSQIDFRQPESALQAARYDLTLAQMSDRYGVAFLRNGAVPGAVVTTRAFADEKQRNRFRRQWAGEYEGPDRVNRTAFHETDGDGEVGKAIDVKVLGLSQKDAQFAEAHQSALGRIAVALGVPWSWLDASGRTYDNADAEDVGCWERTILPKLRTYQDEINMGLAPRLGGEVGWFDLSGVRALQPHFERGDVLGLLDRDVIVIDEARSKYGLAPLANGQGQAFATKPAPAITVTNNNDQGGRSAEPPTPLPAPDDHHGGGDPGRRHRRSRREPVRVTPPARTTRALTPAEQEQRRARLWAASNRTALNLEQQWQRAFRRLFAKQQTATLARLNGKRGRQLERRDTPSADDVFDVDYWTGETEDVADDLYRSVAAAAAARVGDRFDVSFDVEDPRMVAFLRARTNQLAGQVTDTTYQSIVDAMAKGVEAGDNLSAIADRVRAVFDDATQNRAVTIARTEVVSAYNGSTSEFGAIAGPDVVAGQEWIATRDGRTREDHAGADGQVVGIDETFDVGDEPLAYPGDPNGDPANTVNCRCVVALLTPDEMDAQQTDSGDQGDGRTVSLDAARAVLRLAPHTHPRAIRRALTEVPA